MADTQKRFYYKGSEVKRLFYNGQEISKAYYSGTITSSIGQLYLNNWLVFNKTEENCISLRSPYPFTVATAALAKEWDGKVQYSYDKIDWTEWNGETISVAANTYLYMNGTGNTYLSGGYSNFSISDYASHWVISSASGNWITISGNMELLLDYAEVAAGRHPAMAKAAFAGLFCHDKNLNGVITIPATTLTEYCYARMCAWTDIAVKTFPAKIVPSYAYYEMFRDDSSSWLVWDASVWVKTQMYATTIYSHGCERMFFDCIHMQQTPSGMSKIKSVAEDACASMFNSCTSMTKLPELDNIDDLATECFITMFYRCSGIHLYTEESPGYNTNYWISYNIPAGVGNPMISMFYGTTGGVTTPTNGATYYTDSIES